MKRSIFITVAILASLAAVSDVEKISFDIFSSALNGWTQRNIIKALDLISRKYQRDIQSSAGRVNWHGPVVRRVVETNDLRLIEYHEDGYSHTNRWRRPPKVFPEARARMIQEQRNARIARAKRLAALTNGVPKVLADARRAALDSAMYSETNLVIEVGGK